MKYDYCVVSYPKSGRTWLRLLFTDYANQMKQNQLRNLYTHINYGIGGGGEYPRIAYLKTTPESKNFLLTRDPADTLVSYYHDDMVRAEGNKMDGVRGDIDAYCRKNLSTLQSFYEAASEFNYVATIRYEDMIDDTFATVLPMFQELYDTVNETQLRATVDKCEFNNLHKLERTGEVSMRVLPEHIKAGFYKTRKGKVGSAKEELTAETFEWIQEQMSQ